MGATPPDLQCGLLLSHYAARVKFRKLGYISDFSELDEYTAECFSIIQNEVEKHFDKKK